MLDHFVQFYFVLAGLTSDRVVQTSLSPVILNVVILAIFSEKSIILVIFQVLLHVFVEEELAASFGAWLFDEEPMAPQVSVIIFVFECLLEIRTVWFLALKLNIFKELSYNPVDAIRLLN